MEFLYAIATAIVGKIAEYTVGPVVRQISYVTSCKRNLQQLDAAVEKLKAVKVSVANEVDVAERRGLEIKPDVQLWQEKVDNITSKTDKFFQEERLAELKCFHGGFCGNLKIRHQISRKSTKLLPEVVEVLEKRGFSSVSGGILQQEPCSVPTGDYQAFASRTSTVKEIMDELKNPNNKRIGVYGIGGVGKTELVKQVYRQATEDEKNLFDDVVILLDVKENPDLEGIQKKIVEKFGMKINESENEIETIDRRACRLCARIKDKKTLVILDDVWEKIKLDAVGIPCVATCKILLTSRSRKPLHDMSTDKDFALGILEDEETWVLFENKAGDVVKDPVIRTVAIQVAKYCRGLPVLVVTIASTLKKTTSLPLWEDALTCLKEYNSQDLAVYALTCLEWSYNKLNNEELQQFFLLCGIAIRGNKIILTDLLRYGMGLGILGKVSTLKKARNRVLSWVEQLKDFCLLIEDENSKYVRMHDLVRDVANQIALRNHILSSVVDGGGRELKEWSDKDFLEKCTIISLPCDNNISRLPKVLQCQALKMLLLQGDRDYGPLTILPTFFEETKQLNVLALEKICIPSLPSYFQSLKNVQTLCLESCHLRDITLVGELSKLVILSFAYSEFEKLPKEIAQLTHLRLLDLTNCYQLQVIPPGVISSLTRLEDLRINKFGKWDVEGEGSNANLLELKHLSWLTSLQIYIPDANILPANLFSCFELERYQIVIGCYIWSKHFNAYDETLNTLEIAGSIQLDKGLEMLMKKSHQLYLSGTFGAKNTLEHQLDTEEFKQLKRLYLEKIFDFSYFINRKVVFSSLTTLRVYECHGLRFLFSSSMARSLKELKNLNVLLCEIMEEIVLSTRGEDGEENMVNLFPKLQSLCLISLPKLVRFCTSNYIEFSSLEELNLSSCDELESFICDPLNSGEKDREETTLQYSLFNEKIVFPSLTTLRVDECHGLRFLFSSLMARSLNELKNLVVSSCEIMEEIVLSTTGEDGKEKMDNLFPKLQSLRLKSLPKLVRFCTSSYIEFSSLEELEFVDCYELESFICDPPNSGEKDRQEAALQCTLFDKKVVGCRSLETLKIVGSRKLKTIWQNQLVAHQDSFCKLRDVDVSKCESLINMFPPSIMGRLNALKTIKIYKCESLKVVFEVMGGSIDDVKAETAHVDTSSSRPFYCRNLDSVRIYSCDSLQNIFPVAVARGVEQLRNLSVNGCHRLEGIIGEEAEGVIENPPHDHELVFPNVSSLVLTGLPKLKSFYTAGMHTSKWPSLKQLNLALHRILVASQVSLFFREKHDQMEPETTERPVFLIQKDSFPQLEQLKLESEELELGELTSPAEIWYGDGPSPADFFPKLKSVCFIKWAPFSNQAALLFLDKLPNLEKIQVQWDVSDEIFVGEGSGEIYDTSPVSNLQFLELEGCARLNSLDQSSAIPFRNLTTLKVIRCHGLKYLISYSVAKSLVQLKTMQVERCDNIEVIIETDGAATHEIVYFNCPWQYVKLSKLPRLQGFSSGNCIVKFPSLETFIVTEDIDLKIDGVQVTEDTTFEFSL